MSDLTICLPKGMERANAVEQIFFELRRGQLLCIIGESGSGKPLIDIPFRRAL